MKLSFRNVFLVARSEYIKWLLNPRIVMLLAILIPIRELIIVPLIQAAGEMNQPLNIFESCIAVANSGFIVLLLPLAYIVLISSFPTVDGNMLFYIKRMGRKNWIMGEMLFQVFAAFTYCLVVMVSTIVQTVHISFVANGWSIAVTDYDKVYGDISNIRMESIIPPNLHYQISPYKAFFLSYLLMFVFLLLCSMVFLTGCLYSKKLLFFLLLILQVALGCALYSIGNKFMWIFPISHSIVQIHYQKYLRKYVLDPRWSVSLFIALILVLVIISYRKVKKVNLDMIGGNRLL